MFSKFRTGARKAANRQNRHETQDEEPLRPASQRGHAKLVGLHGNRSVGELTELGSRASVVPSTAPILPPIPRVASKASQHGDADPSSPLPPTIRFVDTQKSLAEESSPQSEESSTSRDEETMQPVRSIDEAKASLQADKSRMDASLMPPPPRPYGRLSAIGGNQRSKTDLIPRPVSARTERTSSSRGSSITDVPAHHRLPEPEDWVTPPQAIQLGPQPPPRPKSRLTKLNPLSYLSRKKSSQSPIDEIDHDAIAKRASLTPAAKPVSEDFDPRIKGKVVHDFTSPRPSHFVSVQNLRSAAASDGIELPPYGLYDTRRGSDSNLPKRPLDDPSPERKHVTVFKEDFSDSTDGWRLNPDDRRNQASSGIVDKVAALEKAAKEERRKSSLPAFAVHMPEDLPSPGQHFQTPPSAKVSQRVSQEPETAMTPNSFNSIQQTPDSLKPPKHTPRQDAQSPSPQDSPLADRSCATSPDAPQAFSSLPKHLRSKTASIRSQASRFSFDMAPTGSAAQEKLLEERHRQRAAKRARATSLNSISINEEDGFNEDDIDFDADMEEEIPGMNDEDYDFSGRGGVADMTLDAPGNNFDEDIPGIEKGDGFGMDDDIGGGGLGNMTLETFQSQEPPAVPVQTLTPGMTSEALGLGLHNTGLDTATAPKVDSASTPGPTSAPNPRTVGALQGRVENDINELNTNEFYYDDGEFDGEFGDEFDERDLEGGSDEFDESILDQDFQRGKLIERLKPLPADISGTHGSSITSTRPESADSEALVGKRRSEMTDDTSRNSMQYSHARRSSAYGQHEEADSTAGLTQENLSAYHNALAYAANKAAMQGRFDRKSTTDDSGPPSSPDEPPKQRNVSFNEPRTSSNRFSTPSQPVQQSDAEPRTSSNRFSTPSQPVQQSDAEREFDFDDSMDDDFDESMLDDDAIIDAANAEALENDDDGFYGTEFGFYAYNGSGEAQAFHGGFFGAAGANQVKRSHSGREAFQEPSLTPITERSEWSNRNSMISLAMHGSGISPGAVTSPGALPLPTPGLAQLADQMQQEGSVDDLSLSALMKARRGAFGGSSTSLHSMGNVGTGSRSASPSLYAFQQQQGISPLSGHGIAPPPPLREESEEPERSRAGSAGSMQNPMLTLQTQNLALRPTTSGSDSSPMRRNNPISGRGYGHSRNSSGADSVSYAIQRNDEGDEMWVVEKRRTLDNGDVEILDRNIVNGTL